MPFRRRVGIVAMSRRRPVAYWQHALLALALLMQLCAPLLHAQAPFPSPGRAAAAFCGGNAAPASIRQLQAALQAALPPELRAAFARQPGDASAVSRHAAAACDHCVCASPALLPMPVAGGLPVQRQHADVPVSAPPPPVQPPATHLPPATGPPAAIAALLRDAGGSVRVDSHL